MSLELFKKITDEYVAVSPSGDVGYGPGTVWLHHFGESLLSPIFDTAISCARYKGLKPMLSINPLALTSEKMLRLLNAKPYLLYIMIDGSDEKSFSYMRGVKGQYKKSIKNALELLKLKESLKSDVRIFINSIDIPGREKTLDKIQAFWEQRKGVEGYIRKPFVNWNGSTEEIVNLADEVHLDKCAAPWRYISIAWDGIAVPCCFDFDKLYPLGDVNNESLIDIWNGDRMLSLRNEFAENNITNSLCATCYQGGKSRNAYLLNHRFLHDIKSWAEVPCKMSGFSNPEEWGTWTDSHEAAISFSLKEALQGKELILKIKLFAFLNIDKKQSFKMLINANFIAEYTVESNDVHEYELEIASTMSHKSKEIEIKFEILYPTSPLELGQSMDERKLGIGIYEMSIVEKE